MDPFSREDRDRVLVRHLIVNTTLLLLVQLRRRLEAVLWRMWE